MESCYGVAKARVVQEKKLIQSRTMLEVGHTGAKNNASSTVALADVMQIDVIIATVKEAEPRSDEKEVVRAVGREPRRK